MLVWRKREGNKLERDELLPRMMQSEVESARSRGTHSVHFSSPLFSSPLSSSPLYSSIPSPPLSSPLLSSPLLSVQCLLSTVQCVTFVQSMVQQHHLRVSLLRGVGPHQQVRLVRI